MRQICLRKLFSALHYLNFVPTKTTRICRACYICVSQPARPICLSAIDQYSSKSLRWKGEPKRKKEPITLKKKRSEKPIANIFEKMNLRQLAISVDMGFDELCEFMLEIIPDKVVERCMETPDEPLERAIVLNIVSALKMKPVVVSPPEEIGEDTEGVKEVFPQAPPGPAERERRPPVVTIMGHVDHGKTTLLDALRRSNIVSQEFGGITQHIGAFLVKLPRDENQTVTFLDTPGHSAFKAMRERGARSTDIVVLVVAADDSVMEQTVESIRYAREADVPVIVAVNKCDKPGVNPERVLHDLLEHNIIVEKFGGDSLAVEISALYGRGLDQLQEAILLQSELMQLESTSKGRVEATVIESTTLPGLGKVCTLIVNRGTLHKGKVLVSGTSWGRVRAMSNEFGVQVESAGPSTPVRIAGWRDNLPPPGELALEVENERRAQQVVEYRRERQQDRELLKQMEVVEKKRDEARQLYLRLREEKLNKGRREGTCFADLGEARKKRTGSNRHPQLSIILKCDVDGTFEAIQCVLDTYAAHDQVQLDIVDASVGSQLSEKDVELAAEFDAHIFCFNISIPMRVAALAKEKSVPLEQYNVIYHLVARMKELLTERITPVVERRLMGEGTVVHEYRINDGQEKRQPIAGTKVEYGRMEKGAIWRITRPVDKDESSKLVYEGSVHSMKVGKETVTRAMADTFVGVALEDRDIRFKEGDRVEVFEEVNLEQSIRWDPPGF